MTCERCGHELQVGDYPFCKGTEGGHLNARFGVIGDDIPGGLVIKNGICWPDGTPRRFYSKTEIRKAADTAGLSISGETPKPNQRIVEQRQRDKERR